jgi:hypothetical protein
MENSIEEILLHDKGKFACTKCIETTDPLDLVNHQITAIIAVLLFIERLTCLTKQPK